MNTESLEINILKASEIKDGDIVIVKIDKESKSKLDKNFVQDLYQKISEILKRKIPIYFFPSDVSIEVLRQVIETQENYIKTLKNEN